VSTKTSRLALRNKQIADLIKRLHETENELRHLTGGEVDAVVGDGGKTYLLREAQERLRQSAVVQKELAGMQKAVIDALPAHVALIDSMGIIISVNEAWRRFARENALSGSNDAIGQNYLEICEKAQGDCAEEGPASAAGIRRVLSGELKEFALEYPCHSPTEQRWFREIITPLNEFNPEGAVVTHIDITERKLSELRTLRLNRVYAILSQINSVISHVREPQLLFEGCCHVAVVTGGLRAAWIGLVEEGSNLAHAVAKSGEIEGFLESMHVPNETGEDPCNRAIRQKRPVIVNDIENDPDYAPYREAARARGYRSVAAFPLRLPDRIFGALVLYADQANFFDTEEIKLLEQLANDISLTIKSLEQEKQKLEAENTTRTSEARLRAVFEQAAVGICVIALDYRFIRANKRLCEIMGYTEAEMLSLDSCTEITFLDDRTAETEAFVKILSGRKSIVSERRCVRKDGKVIWARFTLSLLAASGDRPKQFLGVVEDITLRKESEQQLTLLGTCISNLNDVVIVTEADSLNEPGPKIVFANQAFERVSGYKVNEIIGRSPRILQGKKTDRRTLDEIRQALVQRKPIRREILNYAKDGTEYWLEIEIVPILDAQSKCTHFAGIEREVTERKRTQEALRQREQLLRMAGRLTHTGGWYMDVSSREVVWSDDVCDIMECPRGQVLALDAALSLHPNQSRDAITQAMEACARDGAPFDLETEILTTRGHRIWGRVCAEAERTSDGRVKRVWGAFQDITERKRSEEERDRLFNLSEDMLSIGNFDGRLVQVNPAWTRYLGWSAEELTGKPWQEFVHPDDHEATIRAGEKLMLGQSMQNFENRYRARDGSYHWMSWNIHPLVEYRQTLGVTRDVTDQKRAVEVLQLSESRYRSLAAATAQIVWTTDAKGFVSGALPEWQEFTGQSIDEVKGSGWTNAMHPEDAERTLGVWKEAVKNAAIYECEYRLRRRDGIYRDFAVRGTPVLGDDGSIREWVGCCTDISDRKCAEERIREQAAFLDKARDAIIARDLTGKIIFWNRSAERLYGWSREEVIGRNIDGLMFPDPKKLQEITDKMMTLGDWTGEIHHLTKDRREIVVESRRSLVRCPSTF
jgi:PAS domain S-box-containing protein